MMIPQMHCRGCDAPLTPDEVSDAQDLTGHESLCTFCYKDALPTIEMEEMKRTHAFHKLKEYCAKCGVALDVFMDNPRNCRCIS